MIINSRFLYLLTIIFFINNANALYINSDISVMDSEREFFSKVYVNDTRRTNLYNFTVYKINQPGANENGKNIKNGEVVFTPLKKILLPGEQEFFKIFYRGKKDDTERYYKIIISETSLDIMNDDTINKKTLFYPTVSLETYFVVRPKNPKFKYEIDQYNGIIKNTGNTFFRLIIHENCLDNVDSIPYVLHLLPNQSFQDERIKKKSQKYIVIYEQYHSIGNCT